MIMRETPGTTRCKTYHLALFGGVLLGFIFVFGQFNRDFIGFVSDILSPALASIAVATAILTVWRIGLRNGRLSKVWFSLMLGVFMWFLSEVVWVGYPLILNVPTPYPSLADAFGIAGYFPIIFGLTTQLSPFKEAFESRRVIPALVVLLVSGAAVLMALLPVIARGETLLGLLVSSAYPALDIVALLIAIPSLFAFAKGTFWQPFLFLVLGVILALSGHLLSDWTVPIGSYYSGHPLELFFDWGYLSAALGFYMMRKRLADRVL